MSHASPTSTLTLREKIDEAVRAIQSRTQLKPELGIILGSGLGPVAELLTETTTLAYSEIPHFLSPSVEGHAGKLIVGKLNGVSVICLQGRFHLYEGHSMESVGFPTRVMGVLGIHTLIVTNAAGGVNTRFRPGDLMLIEDHLNLMGNSPLRGPNLSDLGPRFPDMSKVYHPECIASVQSVASELNIPLQIGVYAALMGPTYETPAEVRMLRTLGADAVGMSTVPESTVASHMGIKVLGMSCITNLAAGLSMEKLSHDDVIHVSKSASEKMKRLLENSAPKLAKGRNNS